jgi:hypothetical protein
MAQFIVQGPDGGKHVIEGPDNATPDQIEAFASQTLGPTDPKAAAQPAVTDQGDGRSFELRSNAAVPQPDPVASAADARVAKEAAAGLVPQPTVTDAIPFKNDIMAGGEALLNKITGGHFGSPYDEAYAYQQARDRYVQNTAPKEKLAADIAGGIGLTPSLPFVNALRGFRGAEFGNALLNAAGYGGLYGAGDSSGDGRVANALSGMKTGAELAALYPVAKGLGNALEKRALSQPPLPPELASFDPRAVGTAAQLYKEDNLGLPITGAAAQSVRLGDNAMLMDMGPNNRAVGTALAKRTGPEMSTIVKAISGRQRGAEARIDTAIDNAVGPPVNVPQMIDQMQTAKRAAAKPLYDAFRATPVKPTENLGNILDRAKAAGAYDSAARLAAQDGIDVNQASSNGLFIDLIKRGLDSKIETAIRAGDATQARSLSGIASDLRNETDAILRSQGNVARDAAGNVIKDSKTGLPMSIYQQARSVAGEHLRLNEAFENGQKAFGKTLSADQMAHDMRNMSPEERTMYRIGARQQIRSVAENAGTKSGPNPDTASRSMLQTRNAQKKLALIAERPSQARSLSRTLEAETRFDNTSMKALQNSDTALYQAAQKRVPGEIEANSTVHNLTLEGLVASGAKKIIDTLTSNALSAGNVRHAADLAHLLVATGASRDRIITGIEKVIRGTNLSPAQQAALRAGALQALSLGGVSAVQNRQAGANVAVAR